MPTGPKGRRVFREHGLQGHAARRLLFKASLAQEMKFTIGKIRRALYTGARVLGDVQAVSKGRTVKRAENRIIGRLVSRLLRRLWR